MTTEKQCQITFLERKEQSKAFGFLIHGRYGFTGVGLTTIKLSQEACDELQKQGVIFQYDK